MTTGRINQVTVLCTRACARQGGFTGPHRWDRSPSGVCHRRLSTAFPVKKRRSPRSARDVQALPPVRTRASKFLVPRSRTPQELSPGRTGPRSTPSVRTTRERSTRCGVNRNAAVPRLATCNAWPKAINPHRSPSLADAAKGRSETVFQALASTLATGQVAPSQAGTSCSAGASTARSKDLLPATEPWGASFPARPSRHPLSGRSQGKHGLSLSPPHSHVGLYVCRLIRALGSPRCYRS
jgi:hypothetical protein